MLEAKYSVGYGKKMSKRSQKPIDIPSGITVTVKDSCISVKGPAGELSLVVSDPIKAEAGNSKVLVTRPNDSRTSKSLHGLTRSLIDNMIEGVSKGFIKSLEIQGVGFKAAIQGQKLMMWLGFSNAVEYVIPDGVKVVVEGGTMIVVSGPDKQKVGDVAARIRTFFPAEPYKGKGVRYKGEYVRRKVGKTVA